MKVVTVENEREAELNSGASKPKLVITGKNSTIRIVNDK
jgi:hypothetical protein